MKGKKEKAMYLHLGKDISVPLDSILGVFDMDTSTGSKHTRAFLNSAEKEGRVTVVTDELPKSAVVCTEGQNVMVYICQLSAKTLEKRINNNNTDPESLF